MLQDDLALKYNYKKLPAIIADKAHKEYLRSIPKDLNLTGSNINIYSKNMTLISNGYDRIVIGDYGAFIEIDESKIIKDNLCIKTGQEYRLIDEKYKNNVKYIWLTINDDSDVKIYLQKKKVSYADYKPNKYYVSIFETITNIINYDNI